MSRLTRDGTAEPVSRDQIFRHARGQGNIHFPCSADHEQDWQPYPVDPYHTLVDDHTHTSVNAELFRSLYAPYLLHTGINLNNILQYLQGDKCVCVCVCFLPIHSGHQVRWTYQPGSHRRKVTQIFNPPSFCGACLDFCREKDSAIPFLVDREVEFCVLTN